MLRIAIVVGSTRPNRHAPDVAKWVLDLANKRGDATYEIVDIADFDLPMLDEPMPPSLGNYAHGHTKRWGETVASCDGYVFVTPEYNHSISGALKNAIDFVYHEWTNKAAGFVSYGSTGGVRAVEHMRGVMAEIQIADVRAHVSMSLLTDFENYSVFKPDPRHEQQLGILLDQLVAWSRAMQGVRTEKAEKEAAVA
jgi:NAD(P)H-dependent FMN reductase